MTSPITLYLHFPFCNALCTYCSFNRRQSTRQMEAYVAALEWEIAWYARKPELQRAEISSLFLGGGTPSFAPAALIERLLEAVARGFRVSPDMQATIEGNPESITPNKLLRYRRAGINRLSLGVQTFDERRLKQLGRLHGPGQVVKAIDASMQAGIEECSLDLIFGLPGQVWKELASDLEKAMAMPIGHLSLFPMIYRPGTPLHGHRPRGIRGYRLYARALKRLDAGGFLQYTTEDFTRSGIRCQYQVDAWQPPQRPCLGLGLGTLSSFGDHSWQNTGDLDRYIRSTKADLPPVASSHHWGAAEQLLYHLMTEVKFLHLAPRDLEEPFARAFPLLHRAFPALPWLLARAGLFQPQEDGRLKLSVPARFLATRWWSAFILAKLATG